jgi:DME family drug/metabolite transporter
VGARERISFTMVLAGLGLAFLIFGGGGTGSGSVFGIVCALLSAAGYALNTLVNRDQQDPINSSFLAFATGAVVLLPLAMIAGLVPTPASLPLLAYFGLVPTALAYALFYTGLRTIRASTAAVIALVEPLLAALIGVLAFHEHLSSLSLVGAAVLLAAVVLQATRE